MSISSLSLENELRLENEYEHFRIIRGQNYAAKVKYSDFNQRITVKSYWGKNISSLGKRLKSEARRKGYGKIWVKAKASDKNNFINLGFKLEAEILKFYHSEDAIAMSYYVTEERSQPFNKKKEKEIIEGITSLKVENKSPKLNDSWKFKFADSSDVDEMAKLYNQVFDSYPTPIFEPDYLYKTMEKDLIYGLIYDKNDNLISAASADTDPELKNAEMTDFATLPEARGNGAASYILAKLEAELIRRNYQSLYTIARSVSYGMNRVFKRADYEYTGRLIKNCHIGGKLEDMNLWCKVID
ncbi:putative beta-lysine N-acetyltransferase [Sporohalobacter salinus]|uniref:putative beta-lysine N-acetyltransferase n=1 Tax=Sporohalobacter salinus TaxID=1494606 RepID=UPI00195F2B5C|nr:putative beta-lysine N-acetyltransferase [Sporohalobacter salinus]MBM7624858.1 putative beta-lysine N-acetyltransferase [Sporohalobacter salinus]